MLVPLLAQAQARYTQPRVLPIPMGVYSMNPQFLNDRGEANGFVQHTGGGNSMFLWRDGQILLAYSMLDGGTWDLPIVHDFDNRGHFAGARRVATTNADGGPGSTVRATIWDRSLAPTEVGGDGTNVIAMSSNGAYAVRGIAANNLTLTYVDVDGGSTFWAGRAIGDTNDRGDLCFNIGQAQVGVWSNGTETLIPTPGYSFASCNTITNRGHVLLSVTTMTNETRYAIWRGGDAGIAVLPIGFSYLTGNYGMNDSDQVLVSGRAVSPTGPTILALFSNNNTIPVASFVNPDSGFVISEGGGTLGYGINNSGQIMVGASRPGEIPIGRYYALIIDTQSCRDTNGDGNLDDDDDGLCDSWETTGIDFDLNGSIDLVLPGANPRRKDLYVEIDWMEHHRPLDAALQRVTAAFAAAPVMNPDGTTGITAHLELSEQAVEHRQELDLDGTFQSIKQAYFGTAAERASATALAKLGARRLVYRYALFAHAQSGGKWSGIADLPGNDLMVTLGWFGPPIQGHNQGTVDEQAGTLMHELGHTLNLRHGGSDNISCKPNYLSVMNYSFQFDGSPVVGRPLDFSRAALPSLDENNLSEPAGIGGPSGSVTAWYDPMITGIDMYTSAGDAPIDWNDDGNANSTGLSADITLGCSTGLQLLPGFDDWSNLKLNFREAAFFGDGTWPGRPAADDELTFDRALAQSPDSDNDGLRNLEDNCPSVANSAQLDADLDGVGNACDNCAGVFNPGQELSACMSMIDGGTPAMDGGAPADGGSTADAGAVDDGGTASDAGSAADGGSSGDAGTSDDGGTMMTDAGASGGGSGGAGGGSGGAGGGSGGAGGGSAGGGSTGGVGGMSGGTGGGVMEPAGCGCTSGGESLLVALALLLLRRNRSRTARAARGQRTVPPMLSRDSMASSGRSHP